MRRIVTAAILLATGTALGALAQATGKPEPQIGHMVYFQLNDPAAPRVREAVALCEKYLSEHPGVVYFSVGTRADEFKREVNDRDWDVALHFVFKTKADHDRYQDSERHKMFVTAIKPHAKKVRVFDAAIAPK
jgi:hypothetical protein